MIDGLAANVILGTSMTVTVACALENPPVPTAVRVYVVVSVGVTEVEPLAGFAPMPLSIETEVEFVTDHVSVADEPAMTVAGG